MKLFTNEFASLTESERKVVDFLNSETKFFYEKSIEEVASRIHISTGVLTRMYKKLGFKSFKEIQFFVKYKYLNSVSISEKSSISEIIAYHYMTAINLTSKNLDMKKIDYIVNQILTTKKVYLFGVGSSAIAARELGYNLQKLEIEVIICDDFHLFLISIATTMTKRPNSACMIMISKTALTNEFQFLLNKVDHYNMPYLVITSNRSITAKYKHVLVHENLEQNKRYDALTSKIVQQYICDIIMYRVREFKGSSYNDMSLQWIKMIDDWNKK